MIVPLIYCGNKVGISNFITLFLFQPLNSFWHRTEKSTNLQTSSTVALSVTVPCMSGDRWEMHGNLSPCPWQQSHSAEVLCHLHWDVQTTKQTAKTMQLWGTNVIQEPWKVRVFLPKLTGLQAPQQKNGELVQKMGYYLQSHLYPFSSACVSTFLRRPPWRCLKPGIWLHMLKGR